MRIFLLGSSALALAAALENYCDSFKSESSSIDDLIYTTSACSSFFRPFPQNSFTCPDDSSLKIPLSRIDDGICDCCGGGDETGKSLLSPLHTSSSAPAATICPDDCGEITAIKLRERQQVVRNYVVSSSRNLATRKEYAQHFSTISSKVTSLEEKKNALSAQVEGAKGAVKELEEVEKAERLSDRRQRVLSIGSSLFGALEHGVEEGSASKGEVLERYLRFLGRSVAFGSVDDISSKDAKDVKKKGGKKRNYQMLEKLESLLLLNPSDTSVESPDKTDFRAALDQIHDVSPLLQPDGDTAVTAVERDPHTGEEISLSQKEMDDRFFADLGAWFKSWIEDSKKIQHPQNILESWDANTCKYIHDESRIDPKSITFELAAEIRLRRNEISFHHSVENSASALVEKWGGDYRFVSDPILTEADSMVLKLRVVSVLVVEMLKLNSDSFVNSMRYAMNPKEELKIGGGVMSSSCTLESGGDGGLEEVIREWEKSCQAVVNAVQEYEKVQIKADADNTEAEVRNEAEVDATGEISLAPQTPKKNPLVPLSSSFASFSSSYIERDNRSPQDPISSVIFKDFNKNYENAQAKQRRETLTSLEREIKKIEKEKTDLNNEIDDDKYGHEGMLFAMKDSCYKLLDGKYVYEMCPFKESGLKQLDVDESKNRNLKQGDDPNKVATKGSGTSLGDLQMTTMTKDRQVTMAFTGGQKCYNGPKRSAKVTLVCGETDRLVEVDEFEICTYLFVMETTAVCDEGYKDLHSITDEEVTEVAAIVEKEGKKRWFF